MALTKRGGWPYANPLNGQFTLNRQSPQARGLAAWWPAAGARGNRVPDMARGIGSLALSGTGGTAIGHTAAFGTTMRMTAGVSSYWSVANYADVQMGSGVSFEYVFPFFVRSSPSASYRRLGLACKGSGANAEYEMYCYDSNGNQEYNLIYMTARNAADTAYGTATLAHSVVLNRWYWYHGYCDAATNEIGVILRGVGTSTGALTNGVLAGSSSLEIGRYGASDWHIGNVDIPFVICYRRVLSEGERFALYNPATRWELYAPVSPLSVSRRGALQAAQAVAGAMTPSGGPIRSTGLAGLAGGVTPSGGPIRSTGLAGMAGDVTPSGGPIRSTGLAGLAGGVGLSGTLGTVRTFLREMAGSLGVSGTLGTVRTFLRTVAGVLVLGGSVASTMYHQAGPVIRVVQRLVQPMLRAARNDSPDVKGAREL